MRYFYINILNQLLLLFFPCKCPEFNHFSLKTLGVNQDKLARFMKLGNGHHPHTLKRGLIHGICHFCICVYPVQFLRSLAFDHRRLEAWLVACEENMRTGVQDEGVVGLEWIGPCMSY